MFQVSCQIYLFVVYIKTPSISQNIHIVFGLDYLIYCTYTHHSEMQGNIALSLISTIHSSPHRTISFLRPAVSSQALLWQRILTMEILQLPTLRSFLRRISFRTACQLFPQLNWFIISSQPPLQSSTAHITTKHKVSSSITTLHEPKTSPNNTPIVACVFIAAGTCLPSRCLAMNVSSSSTIPAFRSHVTVFLAPNDGLIGE
jgi:hypothetical protein